MLAVPVARLRELVARDPAFGDLVLRAYLLRRSILIGLGAGLGLPDRRLESTLPDTRRVRDFAARNPAPVPLAGSGGADPGAEALLAQLGVTPAGHARW